MLVIQNLSFAGRVQLIASVISGIVNFWLSTFMLPQGCVRKIESLCSRFLWSGTIDGSTGAKISWSAVCLPKEEGGVGLRRFSVWNKTLCLRFIWLLFEDSGSLWARWHRLHNLRNMSFWAIEESSRDSWNWRMLLRLRQFAKRFLFAKVGNGKNVFFWYDSWTPMGPLIKLCGVNGPRSFCIPLSAKVADACTVVGWKFPPPRSDLALNLHIYLTTIPLPSLQFENDYFSWIVDGFDCRGFSSPKTWEALRPRESDKDWFSTVWFKGAVPKHAFNMCVTNLNRLPTRHRLASWGVIANDECCLCSSQPETRDHLLLNCQYAAAIWNYVFSRLTPAHRRLCTWDELLSWTRQRSPQAPSTLRKLAAHASIYHIWRQRNNVLHNNLLVPSLTIFRNIDREIRNTITGRRHRKRWRKLWFR